MLDVVVSHRGDMGDPVHEIGGEPSSRGSHADVVSVEAERGEMKAVGV